MSEIALSYPWMDAELLRLAADPIWGTIEGLELSEVWSQFGSK